MLNESSRRAAWYNRPMAHELEGRIALVTGAASGIGYATCERFIAEGATVIGVDINADGLARLAAATGADTMTLDVTSIDDWQRVVESVVARHGRIDIAFLNAGRMTRPASENMFGDVSEVLNVEGYRRIGSVNADGVVFGTIALVPQMERTGGDIVITASVAGLVPFPHDPFYGLTKHAMVGYARSLGPALESRGIRVNVICPGATDTGILAPDQRASRPAEAWATPDFIADSVMAILRGRGTGEVWVRYKPTDAPWRYEFAPSRERSVATTAAPILPTTDVTAALDRYRALGFEADAYGEDDGDPIYGFLKFGAASLHLCRVDRVDPTTSMVSCYLYVADADALHARWSASGVAGRYGAPVDTPYGLREGHYIDPDGNLIRYGSSV